MSAGYTRDFYVYMHRNLKVLRDVARLIYDARAAQQKTIVFKDENGQEWQLTRLEKVRPKQFDDSIKS